MGYRNLTQGQFRTVKEEAARRCKAAGLTTVADFKRTGNEIIDEIESGKITFADLLV